MDPNEYLTDREIVELYFKRDERAIRETERKYGKYILSVSKNFICDADDMKECENDTYIALWNAIPPAEPEPLTPYIAKIVRHISIDKYKEKTRQKRASSEFAVSLDEVGDFVSDGFSVEAHINELELRRVINEFVDSLPERSRFIFVCRYYSADSAENIAKMLGISKWSIFKELGKLREKLKEKLEENNLL